MITLLGAILDDVLLLLLGVNHTFLTCLAGILMLKYIEIHSAEYIQIIPTKSR